MSGAKRLRAYALSSLLIDAETVAKILRLSQCTQGEPNDDEAERIACTILDAALDAALAEFEKRTGTFDFKVSETKFTWASRQSERSEGILAEAMKVTGRTRDELIDEAVCLAFNEQGDRNLYTDVPESFRDPVSLIAVAAGYSEGPAEALLETFFDRDPQAVFDAVGFSMLRLADEVTPEIARNVMLRVAEEKLRYLGNSFDSDTLKALTGGDGEKGGSGS